MSNMGIAAGSTELTSKNEPMNRAPRRPRFSLLTILLLMTIAGMGVALFRVGSEVVPLREEVRRLRDEVGELVVEDKSKLCAVQVRTGDYLAWKWRIWFPPDKAYVVKCADRNISEDGFNTRSLSSSSFQDGGEHWVSYLIRRDPKDGKCYGSLHVERGSVGKDLHEWVDWSGRSTQSSGVRYSTEVHTSNTPFVLNRYRVKKPDNTEDFDELCPGFLIWIEER